jgi:hypothetical protein
MDNQILQALAGVFQQGLQLIQQAQAGDPSTEGNPVGGSDPYGQDPNQPMDGEMPPPDPTGTAQVPDNGTDMPPQDGNLHDRVSQLESHTGLQKSAGNLPLIHRLDALEEHWLGESYQGSAGDRVDQLENVILGKSAQSSSGAATRTQNPTVDDAPDEIDLPSLIKAAASAGAKQGAKEATAAIAALLSQETNIEGNLPPLNHLRKTARTPVVGERRGQVPKDQGYDKLAKAAAIWGYEEGAFDEDRLDEPAGSIFGRAMQVLLNNPQQATSFDDDD